MVTGVPLWITITARNNQGDPAFSRCKLPTYDVTLPGGRLDADFLSTSHPYKLAASAVTYDDSPMVEHLEGIGYGKDIYGDQVVAWHKVDFAKRLPGLPPGKYILHRIIKCGICNNTR